MLVLFNTQGNCFLLSSQIQKVILGRAGSFLARSALQLPCVSAGSVQSPGSRVCLHVALQAVMNIPRAVLPAPREENLVIQGDGCGGVFPDTPWQSQALGLDAWVTEVPGEMLLFQNQR